MGYNIIVMNFMNKTSLIFKPTKEYNELLILNVLSDKNNSLTQRNISKLTNISLAMVNAYLSDFEDNGLVEIAHDSTRVCSYTITKLGLERKQLLNMKFLESSLVVFNKAKEECLSFINRLQERNCKNILLYGAGEVCELLLYVINNFNDFSLNILGIIDDDTKRIGSKLVNVNIISPNDIDKYDYDSILISSYVHSQKIVNKLLELNIDNRVIIKLHDLLDR